MYVLTVNQASLRTLRAVNLLVVSVQSIPLIRVWAGIYNISSTYNIECTVLRTNAVLTSVLCAVFGKLRKHADLL